MDQLQRRPLHPETIMLERVVIRTDVKTRLVQARLAQSRPLGIVIRLSETPVNDCAPPPMLGEHTEDVLMGLLGYDQEKMADLRAEQAIG